MNNPKNEQRRAYMRQYMQARRAGTLDLTQQQDKARRPQYDPVRDGPMLHASLTAMILGDPPIGRRAIDQQHEAAE